MREMSSSDFRAPATDMTTLIADMFATMYAAEGCGLAANQIGVDRKLFVYDVEDPSSGKQHSGVVCNPVVTVVVEGAQEVEDESAGKHDQKHDHHLRTKDATHAGVVPSRPAGAKTQSQVEGCLSYPGVSARVTRPKHITVRGLSETGAPLEIHASGFLAQILQHETDHLNGLVYGDHVSRAVREKMAREFEKIEKSGKYAAEWPVSSTPVLKFLPSTMISKIEPSFEEEGEFSFAVAMLVE